MNQDFKELLQGFNDEHVRYLIVGGYAVIKHTEPRYTKDLDVWVGIAADNAERVFRALQRFGAPLTGLTPQDFSSAGFFYTMGLAPQRVDVLMSVEKLDFEQCWERRVESEVDGIKVNFLSANDLIINKEAVGRYQDLADAEKLRVATVRISQDKPAKKTATEKTRRQKKNPSKKR